MAPALLCATLEVALNRTLRLEPEVLDDLSRLDGSVLGQASAAQKGCDSH